MDQCSVLSCKVTHTNNPNEETFHRFPVESYMKEKWIQVINRSGWAPNKYSVVCSKHFKEECFMQRNGRRILKRESIPTEAVPVKFGPKSSTQINKDTLPDSVPPRPLTPRRKKLIIQCSKLRKLIRQKQQAIRNLRNQTKRLKRKYDRAVTVTVELINHPWLKDQIKIKSTSSKSLSSSSSSSSSTSSSSSSSSSSEI